MQKVRSRLAAPTVRRHTGSGSFHSLLRVLFTFPSRYLFTIGHQVVLSLGRWSSQIPTGLLVPHGTQVPSRSRRCFAYGGVTLYAVPSQVLLLHPRFVTPCSLAEKAVRSYNPHPTTPACLHWKGLGYAPVRSPLLGGSRLIYFPTGTKMVQFPAFAHCEVRHDSDWVSPFGNPRVVARLPARRGLSQAPTSFIAS